MIVWNSIPYLYYFVNKQIVGSETFYSAEGKIREGFKITKEVIRSRSSKNNRQYNGKYRKDKTGLMLPKKWLKPLIKGQTMQCPKLKDRQCNDQSKRTDNAMTKAKGQTMQWPKLKDRQCND